MSGKLRVLAVQRVDDLVDSFRADGLLIVLDKTVSIDGVGNRAAKVEGDSYKGTVGGHSSNAFLQFSSELSLAFHTFLCLRKRKIEMFHICF